MKQVLTEEDRGKLERGNSKKKIENISDLVLVHLTDYIPEDGVIKSSKDAGVTVEQSIEIGGETYTIQYPSERGSVHFCLNGEVESHNYGNWDGMKYAIIIPLEKMDMQSIVGGISVDIYTRGSVQIPEGSYILCPESETENVRKLNKNLTVVGYEGKGVNGYANTFLSRELGYKKKSIGEHGWVRSDNQISERIDAREEEAFSRILSEYGWKEVPHTGSEQDNIAMAKMRIHQFAKILELIKNNHLVLDNQAYERIYSTLSNEFMGNSTGGANPSEVIAYDNSLRQQLYKEISEAIGEGFSPEAIEKWSQIIQNGQQIDKSEQEKLRYSH